MRYSFGALRSCPGILRVESSGGRRHQQANRSILLVQHEEPAVAGQAEAQVRATGARSPLLGVLLSDEFQQRLRLSIVVEQDPPNGILAALGQIVGIDVEDLAAGLSPNTSRPFSAGTASSR